MVWWSLQCRNSWEIVLIVSKLLGLKKSLNTPTPFKISSNFLWCLNVVQASQTSPLSKIQQNGLLKIGLSKSNVSRILVWRFGLIWVHSSNPSESIRWLSKSTLSFFDTEDRKYRSGYWMEVWVQVRKVLEAWSLNSQTIAFQNQYW